MNDHLCIASDVKLGKDVRLSKFINLYGCEVGDETKIGAFVEVQKNACIGKRCKISSHTFICEGVTIEDNVFVGHGVTFINDSYPRSTTENGALQDRGGLEGGNNAGKAGSLHRFGLHDSVQCHDWGERHRGRRQRRHERYSPQQHCLWKPCTGTPLPRDRPWRSKSERSQHSVS